MSTIHYRGYILRFNEKRGGWALYKEAEGGWKKISTFFDDLAEIQEYIDFLISEGE